MKNYKVKINNIEVSAIWHEPKQENGRGIYTVGITKSEKDESGNWKNNTVYLFPGEAVSVSKCLEKIINILTMPEQFEIKKDNIQVIDVKDIDSIPF